MTIKVEKGIPIPTRTSKHKVHEFPFDHMEDGDSFALPFTDKKHLAQLRAALSSAFHTWEMHQPDSPGISYHLTTRANYDDNIVRVWFVVIDNPAGRD